MLQSNEFILLIESYFAVFFENHALMSDKLPIFAVRT